MNNKYGNVISQYFTHEQVKEINKKIKENIVQEEEESYAASDVSKIGDFFVVPCMPLLKLLHPWLYDCQQINREIFGYDIDWQWHLDTFNYNVYGENGEYGWHVDANNKNQPTDIKLTCMLNLSEEPYEGGDFYMINSNKKIEFSAGWGTVFNSLLAHKVTPVTQGERITLTYFAQGPSWR